MNSQKLECNNDQGWKAIEQSHIALQGKACERFKSDPTVLLNATSRVTSSSSSSSA
jgi:hypothetical protein